MSPLPRVLLADDHTLVLEGFRKLLSERYEVVGTVEDGRALLEAAPRLQPDLVTLDISMPLLNGIDAARQLKKLMPEVKLVFVTMHADPAYVNEAFKAGASGYLLKRSAGAELIQAIDSVLGGHFYITPLITKDLIHSLLDSGTSPVARRDSLTLRQREVLQLVAEGRSNKEIAKVLNISAKTVEFHKAQIMEQLNLHTTAELTKYAIAHGLTTSQ
ncbi:MAG TPA: response regulator transcription factor [Nitrospiraceae bacterium]|jgi:DNA-binding NarL/FixJ family response regulator|nr:response regulator transcription factor [Nitrospiraceae bacterium]